MKHAAYAPFMSQKTKGTLVIDVGDHRLKAVWSRPASTQSDRRVVWAQTPSQGFEDGRIVEMPSFVDSLKRLRTEIESRAGARTPARVVVGLNTRSVQVHNSRAVIPLTEGRPRAVTRSDLDQVRRQANLLGSEPQNLVIWDEPVSYCLDATEGIRDPLGLFGRKLEIRSLLWSLPLAAALNLKQALVQAGWKCEGWGLNPLGAYWALGSQRQASFLGLLDLGASGCGLYTFHRGRVCHAEHGPFGVKTITLAMSRRFSVEEPVAEQLKINYATVLPEVSSGHEILLQKPQGGYATIQFHLLRSCVDPWMDQLLSWIQKVQKNIPYWDRLVVCGGGALLDGLAERLERTLRIPVELARPSFQRQSGINGSREGLIFLAPLGLAERSHQERTVPEKTAGSWMRRLGQAAKRWYDEYF